MNFLREARTLGGFLAPKGLLSGCGGLLCAATVDIRMMCFDFRAHKAKRFARDKPTLGGALKRTGSLSRSAGLWSAISKNVQLLSLKPVKRITVTYDPFHENAKGVRGVAFQLSTPNVIDTNPYCITKQVIVCARQSPRIVLDLDPDFHEAAGFKQVNIDASHFTTLEILQLMNKHISVLSPNTEVYRVVKRTKYESARKIRQ